MDPEHNVIQEPSGGNAPPPSEEEASVIEARDGWLRFMRFVERLRRLDAGESLLQIVR